MKIPRLVRIIAICLTFIVVVVVQAIVALYIFVSNAFTADIMILLLSSVAALVIFTVYLFILKLTEFTRRKVNIDMVKIFKPKKTEKKPPSGENHYEQQLALKESVSPEIPPDEVAPPVQHRPVFEKREQTPEKKSFKPVFGSGEENEDSRN